MTEKPLRTERANEGIIDRICDDIKDISVSLAAIGPLHDDVKMIKDKLLGNGTEGLIVRVNTLESHSKWATRIFVALTTGFFALITRAFWLWVEARGGTPPSAGAR